GFGASCSDHSDVLISLDDFSSLLQGECGDIVVTGSGGSLTVDTARSIRVEGSDVTVINSAVATVDVTGSDNSLNLTRAGTVRIGGDRNVLAGHEIDEVELSGTDNTVAAGNKPVLRD